MQHTPLYYLPSVNKYLGRCGVYDPQEVIEAGRLEKQWKSSRRDPTFYELLEIFPEAKPAMKRNLLADIKQYKQDLTKAEEIRIKFNVKILSRVNMEDKWLYSMIRDMFFVEPLTEGREKEIKKNYFLLSALRKEKTEDVSFGKITPRDVARAKAVPIEYLIQANHAGFAVCPFHGKDRTPSLRVYKNTNRWYCYSCNAGNDTIDFVQKRDNCDFITAVKILIK